MNVFSASHHYSSVRWPANPITQDVKGVNPYVQNHWVYLPRPDRNDVATID